MMKLSQREHAVRQRGVAMVLALFLVVIALLVSIAVLTNTTNSANSSLSVQTKNMAFDAAETGLNTAVQQIDANNAIPSRTIDSTKKVNGYSYTWEVVQNNLGKLFTTPVNDVNPAFTGTITVGPNQAYLAGWASSITGGRTVWVEAMAVPGPPIPFTGGAIISGQTAQISHDQITDKSGKHSGDIHGHTITSSGGGQTPDGNSYATGTSNAIIGLDGKANINWAAPTFLTSAQLATIQNNALSAAQTGGSNVYVNGNWSGAGTWGASGANCTVYINGNVSLSGNGTLTNWCTTTVVTGNWTMIGNIQYTISPSTTSHALYVLGSGGATFNGTTNTAGFVYSANGPITLNGSGTGSFTGVLYSPYNITMSGGGGSAFSYDPNQIPPGAQNPNVTLIAQWEY